MQADKDVNNNNAIGEAWILMEFVPCEELLKADAAARNTEECQLKASCACQGEVSNELWKSCADCQSKDYED